MQTSCFLIAALLRSLRTPQGQPGRATQRKGTLFAETLASAPVVQSVNEKHTHARAQCKHQYYTKRHLIPPPPCPHVSSKDSLTEKQTYTDLHTVALAPTHPSRSRPDGGLHRNRSFVTHDVPGQGMHYR